MRVKNSCTLGQEASNTETCSVWPAQNKHYYRKTVQVLWHTSTFHNTHSTWKTSENNYRYQSRMLAPAINYTTNSYKIQIARNCH